MFALSVAKIPLRAHNCQNEKVGSVLVTAIGFFGKKLVYQFPIILSKFKVQK